jgi:hypothetical protein
MNFANKLKSNTVKTVDFFNKKGFFGFCMKYNKLLGSPTACFCQEKLNMIIF